MTVADTDVLVDSLHRIEPSRTRIADGLTTDSMAVSAISVFELHAGARSDEERDAVDSLLGALEVLPVDEAVARVGAAVERDLRRRGLRIGFADALIAGTCLVAGASLLTRNARHFGRVTGLRLESVR